jgi:N-acyl-L-homoserine lactone synthetase
LASAFLFEASLDLAASAGIESIIGNLDDRVLRLLKSLGCEVETLGSTSRYGRPIYLGLYRMSEPAVGNIRRKLEKAGMEVARMEEIAA